MTWYLEYLDLEGWKTILYGYTFPKKDVDGCKIPKNRDEYSEEENRKCHTPIPGPTRMVDPNRVRGTRLYTGTLYFFFYN